MIRSAQRDFGPLSPLARKYVLEQGRNGEAHQTEPASEATDDLTAKMIAAEINTLANQVSSGDAVVPA